MKDIIAAGLAELGLADRVPEQAAEQLAQYGRLLLEKNMLSLATWYTICNSGLYDPEKMLAIPLPSDLAKEELCLCMLHRPEQKVRYQERILFTCIESYFKNYILPPMEESPETEVQQ